MTRRFLLGAVPLALAGCADSSMLQPRLRDPRADRRYLSMYAPVTDDRFPLPGIDLKQIDPKYWRQEVYYSAPYPVGTIVVDPANKFLYLTERDGKAIRYGVGVGREGFGWSGKAVIKRKQAWPTWTPPAEMVARDPRARPFAKGQPPGPENALGARALYLYQGDRDTLYRLHGTAEPWSIGHSMSSGCIRLINQDIIDLYNRVPIGTEVVVLDSSDSRFSSLSNLSNFNFSLF
ncbi:L,D-transpeptidase [Hartmannibacter diazotrophicus]|nr:L,D-transpeptidase [Hartmannibacter diazotrophicus]